MPKTACSALASLLLLLGVPAVGGAESGELLYSPEGNRLHRYDVDTIGTDHLLDEVLIEQAAAGPFASAAGGPGRDVNGTVCVFPDGSGRFVMGEDTDQNNPPPGWGVFDARGQQLGRLNATYQVTGAEPFGCAFDPNSGILYTTSVGNQGFGNPTGQLIMWFPPYEGYPGPPGAWPNTNEPSHNFCKLAIDIATAGTVAVDSLGRIWVASTALGGVLRFQLPTLSAGQSFDPRDAGTVCSDVDPQGSPILSAALRGAPGFRTRVIAPDAVPPNGPGKMDFFSGLAFAANGNLYAASVLTGRIAEYTQTGAFVRYILDHGGPVFGASFSLPEPYGNPQGIAIGADGSVYYGDLDLHGALPNVDPGSDGKVWRIRFDAGGDPMEPEMIRDHLDFPDGVAIVPGNLQKTEWLTFAGGPQRQFHNTTESIVTRDNVAGLAERWSLTAGAVITDSPTVAQVDLPGEGLTQVVYFQSWDLDVYAVRLVDGSVVWRFTTEDQPGASFPATASVHVVKIANRDRVIVAQGEILYALDAVTGEELWRFTAGTGCSDGLGHPPGLCGFAAERNEIESSAYVAEGLVFFGMDVNDVETGKGGFYAVDASDGRLAWFFDLESGQTCRPLPGDDIRRYDPYHGAEELGLPADFFATRPGCDHPRNPNGCGNVWSSAAVDASRRALFVASSNCDMPIDAMTGEPETMPPFDEAIFSLDFDGNPRWVWRPRRADNDDLAFGAVPNLFRITLDLGGTPTEVDAVGVGNKDGTYYVLDRDGVNQQTGEAWDDDPASHLPAGLPYWSTKVVPGGDIGGILSTAAVDEGSRRIHFTTAPGTDEDNAPPAPPQTPTVHTLDMDTGAILWEQGTSQASFSSTSLIPGVVFHGTSVGAQLTARDADDGTLLGTASMANLGMGSTAVVIDGTVIVGSGIGTRTNTGSGPSDFAANIPSRITAWCVPGTAGCAACNDGIDNDGDGHIDAAEDAGCVDAEDASEVLGDLDYDGDVDASDRNRIYQAFGRKVGEPGYRKAADLYPPGAPDGIVDLRDYQAWLAAEKAANPPPPPPAPACGLLGPEPLLALALLRLARRRRRARRGLGLAAVAAAAALGAAPDAHATATLRFDLPASAVVVGGVLEVPLDASFDVDLVADLTDPIVGFGLDVTFDGALLSREGVSIGPDWVAVAAADGDGLAGLAPLPGVSGLDVVLATLHLKALALGSTDLTFGITPGDFSEGFALEDLGAFDAVVFGDPLPVQVVPEPASGLLLALGLAALSFSRSRGSRAGCRGG